MIDRWIRSMAISLAVTAVLGCLMTVLARYAGTDAGMTALSGAKGSQGVAGGGAGDPFGLGGAQGVLQRLQEQQEADARAPAAAAASAEDEQAEAQHRVRVRFALWGVVFVLAMLMLLTKQASPTVRCASLAVSVAIFGVLLGAEPNAPGALRNVLVVWGQRQIFLRPSLIALILFLLMSIVGNKVFCGWGCQFGALQDLASYLPGRKIKPPFWISNTVRGLLMLVFLMTAAWGHDIFAAWDPFRLFALGFTLPSLAGLALVAVGAFIYRPWCTFFCPFGFLSWLAERVALTRPRVNHRICIDCRRCEKACPTHCMEGLWAQAPFHQDCFACGECVRVCPVAAIGWGVKPPKEPMGR